MKKQLLFLSTLLILFTPLLTAQSVIIDSVLFTNGNSLSTSLNTKGYQITALKIPDALSGTAITFQVNDGLSSTYYNLLTNDGGELKLTIPSSATLPNRKILVQPADNLGFNHLVKLRTGTYASPTTQSSSIWVIVELTKMIGS